MCQESQTESVMRYPCRDKEHSLRKTNKQQTHQKARFSSVARSRRRAESNISVGHKDEQNYWLRLTWLWKSLRRISIRRTPHGPFSPLYLSEFVSADAPCVPVWGYLHCARRAEAPGFISASAEAQQEEEGKKQATTEQTRITIQNPTLAEMFHSSFGCQTHTSSLCLSLSRSRRQATEPK